MPIKCYSSPGWLKRWASKCQSADGLDISLLPERQRPKLAIISYAKDILEEYEAQGYQLTLRQLYYQFVSRGLIENTARSYDRLGSAISDGRMWGLIDWGHIVDRGRNLESKSHWSHPGDVIASAASSYALDLWEDSDCRVEVWVEKQALEDVVAKACEPSDCAYIACKGYMSQSEVWAASQRLIRYEQRGQTVIILHLGDHDPSGIDMTRDNMERLVTFGAHPEVIRIALNRDQIERYSPPPNPAKVTDSRFREYELEHGDESWELDALEPSVIAALITEHIDQYKDDEYHRRREEQEKDRELLEACSDNWGDVVEFLNGKQP